MLPEILVCEAWRLFLKKTLYPPWTKNPTLLEQTPHHYYEDPEHPSQFFQANLPHSNIYFYNNINNHPLSLSKDDYATYIFNTYNEYSKMMEKSTTTMKTTSHWNWIPYNNFTDVDFVKALEKCGLFEKEIITNMYLNNLDVIHIDRWSTDYEIELVDEMIDDGAQLWEFWEIVREGFGMDPLTEVDKMVEMNIDTKKSPILRRYMGYVKNENGVGREAVNTGAYLVMDGNNVYGLDENVACIYYISTRSQWRGRGLANMMMKKLLMDARDIHKCKRAVLHATEDGKPLYLKLGFNDITSCYPYNYVGSIKKNKMKERQ